MPFKDPAARLEAHRRWAAKNRDRLRAYHAARYQTHKSEARARATAYREAHREHLNTEARRTWLLRKWGLTPEMVAEQIARQGGGCAVCRGPLLRMHVDHDHSTGQRRGLLCQPCNHAIGLLRDDPGLMERAALYVASASW